MAAAVKIAAVRAILIKKNKFTGGFTEPPFLMVDKQRKNDIILRETEMT